MPFSCSATVFIYSVLNTRRASAGTVHGRRLTTCDVELHGGTPSFEGGRALRDSLAILLLAAARECADQMVVLALIMTWCAAYFFTTRDAARELCFEGLLSCASRDGKP